MKKMAIVTAMLAVLCCGCGSAAEQISTAETTAETEAVTETEAAEETTAEETSAAEEAESETEADAQSAEETTAQEETAAEEPATEEARDAEFCWFEKGVYEAHHNDNRGEFYVFYDTRNGKVVTTETGLGFTCEQMKGEVVFHMGSDSDTTILLMDGPDSEGNITGEMGEAQYTFVKISDDPDNFDPAEWIGQGDLIVE